MFIEQILQVYRANFTFLQNKGRCKYYMFTEQRWMQILHVYRTKVDANFTCLKNKGGCKFYMFTEQRWMQILHVYRTKVDALVSFINQNELRVKFDKICATCVNFQ